ncbi:hypothetical protein N0V90_003313 [Kalmusia sp. IMI 367209]|nr:hypothetical protein N0V90_003313 [Kalmusia sp. IMI 367209]
MSADQNFDISNYLNADVIRAIDEMANHFPDSVMVHPFEGDPVLTWVNYAPPGVLPQPPHPAYSDRTRGTGLHFAVANVARPPPPPRRHVAPPRYPTAVPAARGFGFFPSITSAPNSLDEIVHGLLTPGFSREFVGAEHHGMATIDMKFVTKILGSSSQHHLEFSEQLGREVFRQGSELGRRGRELGLPDLYLRWLWGVDGAQTLRIPLQVLQAAAIARINRKKAELEWAAKRQIV